MSVDNKHRVRIVHVSTLDFQSKKTGQAGQMKFAQCIVTSQAEGEDEKIVVGELLLPKHLADVSPGDYLADFELAIDREKRIGTRLVSLVPFVQAHGNGRATAQAKDSEKKVA